MSKKNEQDKLTVVIAVDLDGTHCKDMCWNELACREAKPRKDIIKKVNELYKEYFIVIYSARRSSLYQATIDWLRKNEVKYHAIHLDKMPADVYIDDKSLRPEEIDKI